MTWWVLWLALLTVLSYLADTGLVDVLRDTRVPVLNASVISVLMLVSTLGLLYRIQGRKKAGEKEQLKARIAELEGQMASKGASSAS
jgi:hypothetical protein